VSPPLAGLRVLAVSLIREVASPIKTAGGAALRRSGAIGRAPASDAV